MSIPAYAVRKEAFGGCYLIAAEDIDEAIALAAQCPRGEDRRGRATPGDRLLGRNEQLRTDVQRAGVARACGGDLELAENATAEAFVAALEAWPRDGVPAQPGARLATTARRKALDRLRRARVYAAKLAELERQVALTQQCAAGVHDPRRAARADLQLLPGAPEPAGLLALMLLHQARRGTRTGPDGDVVLLADQDRSRWDGELIGRAEQLLLATARHGGTGRYGAEAAIALVHASAPSYAGTDWPAVVVGYRRLLALSPSPVVRLNHAIAVGMAAGRPAGLALLRDLDADLAGYHYLQAARSELLRLAGDLSGARASCLQALELVGNEPERRLPAARLAALPAW